MTKANQIQLIKEFIISNDGTLLINQVKEEFGLFYLNTIKYFAKKYNKIISIDNNTEKIRAGDDLFGQNEIKIFNTSNTKNLTTLLNLNNKKIIFTDYKNFKNLNLKFNSINAYKFEFDIIFFIKDELRINNDELIYFCKNNPSLLISETSKYLINDNQYTSDQTLVNEKNHILDIRRYIFENKKNNFNIKNLYLNIKKEAEYKKLSFLTY